MTITIEKGDLKKALASKFGFEQSEGGNHEKFILLIDGKKVATTFFSRNLRSTTLGPTLLRRIADQVHLEPGGAVGKLSEMVSCTVGREEYLNILKEGGFLD